MYKKHQFGVENTKLGIKHRGSDQYSVSNLSRRSLVYAQLARRGIKMVSQFQLARGPCITRQTLVSLGMCVSRNSSLATIAVKTAFFNVFCGTIYSDKFTHLFLLLLLLLLPTKFLEKRTTF